MMMGIGWPSDLEEKLSLAIGKRRYFKGGNFDVENKFGSQKTAL